MEVECWLKNFEKGSGPAQTMENMNWLSRPDQNAWRQDFKQAGTSCWRNAEELIHCNQTMKSL